MHIFFAGTNRCVPGFKKHLQAEKTFFEAGKMQFEALKKEFSLLRDIK